MKSKTVFEAFDGARFDTKKACEKYEELAAEVECIMLGLRKPPDSDGCSFSNGGGFLQHPKEAFLLAQRSLSKIARRSFKDRDFDRHFDHAEASETPVGLNLVSRIISEGCPRPLDRAWHRLCCVDDQFREWGQPYYAIHPTEGKQVAL